MHSAEKKGAHHRFACLGPGGWKCRCCTPAPQGRKMRRFFRLWKRRERAEVRKYIQELIAE
jgi:hypothetical protein